MKIIYLHGFKDSEASASDKGKLLAEKLGAITPEIPVNPLEAIGQLDTLIQEHKAAKVCLFGHSLGGFYASHLATRYNLPCILTNPSVKPQNHPLLIEILKDTPELIEPMKAALTSMDRPITNPEMFLVLVQRNDSLLDYRQAVEHYSDCNLVILRGGSHAFNDYTEWLHITEHFYNLKLKELNHDD